MPIKKPRKLQIGDLVNIDENAQVLKFHKHPLEVLHYIQEVNNPKLVYSDSENVLPEAPQNYLISDARDYFDNHGYRTRMVKLVGIIDSTEGWLPAKSVKLVFEGSDDQPV